MRHPSTHGQLAVLTSFLILSLSMLLVPDDVLYSMPTIPEVSALDWATPPTRWMNVTGGTGSQSWLFRVGYPPSSFSADLIVGEVTDLLTWEFKIKWDAALLNLSSVVEGAFLQSGGSTTFFFEVFQDQVDLDYVLVNCTLQTGPGVTGSGVIATVDFEVDSSVTYGGTTSLDLYETKLLDKDKNVMSHALTDGFAMVGDLTYFPLIYLTPQTTVADPDEMFNVTVCIDEVFDLYAWGLTLKWSPFQLLTCLQIDNHVFLQGSNPFTVQGINNLGGTAYAGATLQGHETPGTSGSGALATFTFKVNSHSIVKSNLEIIDTDLVAIDLSLPPGNQLYLLPHAVFSGFFRSGKPAAVFTYTPEPPTTRAAVNQPILFNATESSDPGGSEIISYYWDFGDGTTLTEPHPTTYHAYTQAGSYTVNLTVTTSEGRFSTTSKPAGAGGPEIIIRDIAVTSVTASHVVAMQNVHVNVSVTVINNGTDREAFSVEAYARNESSLDLLGDYDVTLQRAGDTATLYFAWDTTDYAFGDYIIQGVVPPLPWESSLTNNKINATSKVAHYNLVNYSAESAGRWFNVLVESNSSLPYPHPFKPTTFKFNSTAKEISFNVTGPSGYFSYSEVTIPKTLLVSQPLSEWAILLDSTNIVERLITENGTHTFLHFNYTLSEHMIQIIGTETGEPPAAMFTVAPTSAFYFTNQILTFNASGSRDPNGQITKYFFDFDDGSNATGTPNYNGEGQLANVTWLYKPKNQVAIQFTRQTPVIEHNYTSTDTTDLTWQVTLTVWDNELFNATSSALLKIFEAYDVALTSITVSNPTIRTTETASVNVTLINKLPIQSALGIRINLYGNNSLLATETRTIPPAGTSLAVTIQLNSTAMALGVYRLNATAYVNRYGTLAPPNFPEEDSGKLSDNQRSYGYITIKLYDSQLTIQTTPSSLTFGGQVIVNIQLLPARTGARITLESQLGAGAFVNITTVTTRLGGQYQHLWVPTQAGIYKLRARWLGDPITSGNVSNTQTITVAQIGSTITLDLSSSSIAKGASVSISGKVDPMVPNKQVTVYYRLNGVDWIPLPATSTDPESNYSLQWTPTEAGTYDIKAKWPGDVNTAASESETKQLQVRADGFSIDPLYIVAGIAIVVIAVLAVYLLKRRKA